MSAVGEGARVEKPTREQMVAWVLDYNGPHSEAIYLASRWFGKAQSTFYRYVREAGGWRRSEDDY